MMPLKDSNEPTGQTLLTDDCVELGCHRAIVRRSDGTLPRAHQPAAALDADGGGDSPVFFRITHTGLGAKKHCEKGSVLTSDLGVQLMPLAGVQGEAFLLDMTVSGSSGFARAAKLATWMSEPSVGFDDLRQNWKIWKLSPPLDEGAASHSLWDLKRVNLKPHGVSAEDEGACRRLLGSMVAAKAFGGSGRAGEIQHCYVPGPGGPDHDNACELALMNVLKSSGIVVQSGLGFRPLRIKGFQQSMNMSSMSSEFVWQVIQAFFLG